MRRPITVIYHHDPLNRRIFFLLNGTTYCKDDTGLHEVETKGSAVFPDQKREIQTTDIGVLAALSKIEKELSHDKE
jgi:hypothetical protein